MNFKNAIRNCIKSSFIFIIPLYKLVQRHISIVVVVRVQNESTQQTKKRSDTCSCRLPSSISQVPLTFLYFLVLCHFGQSKLLWALFRVSTSFHLVTQIGKMVLTPPLRDLKYPFRHSWLWALRRVISGHSVQFKRVQGCVVKNYRGYSSIHKPNPRRTRT